MISRMFGHLNPGLYIGIDGIRCCGKTTQLELLEKVIRLNYPEVDLVVTKEPGGLEKSNQIREVIVTKPISGMALSAKANVLLFAASRAQSIAELIKPALREGKLALTDRSVLSSMCYQAFGDSNGQIDWQWIYNLNYWAVDGVLPDFLIVPEISPELSAERQAIRSGRDNIYDAKEFEYYQRVAKAYHDFALQFPDHIWLLDGSLSIETQQGLIWERVKPMIEENLETRRELLRGKEGVG